MLAAAALALALNQDVRQDTIHSTICVPGYSATARPGTAYTNPVKFRLMDSADVPREDAKDWALDHKIPIALGGHPRKLDNLQLLTREENSRKARIEVKLLCYVCTGAMPLAQAQQEVVEDWRAAYWRHAGEKCRR